MAACLLKCLPFFLFMKLMTFLPMEKAVGRKSRILVSSSLWPSHTTSITAIWPVPNYTTWWQKLLCEQHYERTENRQLSACVCVCVFRWEMCSSLVRRTTRRPKTPCCCGVSEWSTATPTCLSQTSPRPGETEKHSLQSCIDTGHSHFFSLAVHYIEIISYI